MQTGCLESVQKVIADKGGTCTRTFALHAATAAASIQMVNNVFQAAGRATCFENCCDFY